MLLNCLLLAGEGGCMFGRMDQGNWISEGKTVTWRVFYSYSHKDAEWRQRVSTYLAPLKHQDRIVEWHDREVAPGTDWNTEISAQLESANLIVFLISADFLASDYCFGIERVRALERLKRGEVKVAPILLKPCLWQESVFSALQFIPRDNKPVSSWASADDALLAVANEIRAIVLDPTPALPLPQSEGTRANQFANSLEPVRAQIRSYANLYERTRQRMRASNARTSRMEQIFGKLQSLACASYPLLDELAQSPSPGERLAAVAILQVFATERYLPFLVRLVGSEKPFIGYHAAKALRFAVNALDPRAYPLLSAAIEEAQEKLKAASVGFDSDRLGTLREAGRELQATLKSLAAPEESHD